MYIIRNSTMHIAENLLRGVINYYLFWTGHSAKSSPEDYIGKYCLFWTGLDARSSPKLIYDYSHEPYDGLIQGKNILENIENVLSYWEIKYWTKQYI